MIFAFGEHELDEERFVLRRGGSVVELQPKALELLFHLVRHRDRVILKQEILDALWPDSVVTDNSLARAVSLARLAIGDRDTAPPAIATVARKGYRFQAPVSERAHVASEAPTVRETGSDASRYVGRVELVARLETLVDAALSGRGRILFLAGEAGIGKTRTAELLMERARSAGAEVATAWGLEAGAPTYWTWTRVLRALSDAAPDATAALSAAQRADLARILPELGAGEDFVPVTTRDGESVRFRLFETVLGFLVRLTSRRPVALVLDDLHEADAESLWLLEFLGHAIGTLPIVVVVTCREDHAGRAPQRARALERLLRLTALERWPLTGFRSEEVIDFLRTRLGSDPDRGLADALERKTAGNPLLLGESLRSLEARGLLGEARPSEAWDALLPDGIQHLLRPKLRCLPQGTLDMLACAATLGAELDPGLLARCVVDPADLDAQLREAEDATLLTGGASTGGRLRFAHVLVRDALYAELVPLGEPRRALHARVLSVLEADGLASDEALAERAHHACEGAPLVEAAQAVALARGTAAHAARLQDFERAAVWYQRALDVVGLGRGASPILLAELHLGLGDAQTRAVGLEPARATFRQAATHARSAARGDLLARAALGFAHRPSATGHGEPSVIDLLEEAMRGLSEADTALRIRLLSRLAGELRYAERERAEALVEEAVVAARRLGDAAVLAHTLDDCSFVRWSPDDPHGWVALNAEIARAGQESSDLELVLLGQKGRVTGFLEIGDLAGVDREVQACERTAAALRTPYARWLSVALRAMRALLGGALEEAERHVSAGIPLGERVDSPDVGIELQAQLVYLRFEQGRTAEIEPAARHQVERFPDAPAWRAALARMLVAVGRPDEAGRELDRLARHRFLDVPRDRGWLPTLAFAAEVAAATNDLRQAEVLEALLAPYAALGVVAGSGLLYYGPVAHHLGLLAAARSHWDDAILHFETALAAENRAGARVWEARTQLAHAAVLLARGGRSDRPRAARLVAQSQDTARTYLLPGLALEAREREAALWTSRGEPKAQRRIIDR